MHTHAHITKESKRSQRVELIGFGLREKLADFDKATSRAIGADFRSQRQQLAAARLEQELDYLHVATNGAHPQERALFCALAL